MVSAMSADTAATQQKILKQAIREAAPATKADIDRLFDEIRRLQDAVGVLQRNGSAQAPAPVGTKGE